MTRVDHREIKLTFMLAFSLLFISISNTAFAQDLTIMRERAVLREGPGSFYGILAELPVGTSVQKIEEEENWLHVRALSSTGYISPRVTREAPPRQDAFSRMGMQETTLDVSQHAMSAGIKGFGERFSQTFQGDQAFLDMALSYSFDSREYRRFKRQTYRGINVRSIRRKNSIPEKKDLPDYYTLAEEGLGLGIASRIAQMGIYQNKQLTDYINFVGNLVVEASDVFDNTYKFFILDIDNPNAYACPGSIIFITKGMLKAIDNEAELALVLAHELAHSARFHGIIEMEHRKHHISSDDTFAEMDRFFEEQLPNAIQDDTKDLIKKMEELSFEIFETIIQGRLDEYEEEADYLGMIYSLRAGYAPQGFISLLQRLVSSNLLSNNEHYTPEMNKKRIEMMGRNLKKIDPPKGLLTNRDRYRANVSL